MSKRPKRKLEQAVTAGVDVQADQVIAILNDGEYFEHDGVAIEPSRVTVDDPLPPEDYTLREILHPEISPLTKEEESIAESLPRFRPRDCVQCTAKRPTRSSYSRVYCTKGNTRYIRCGWKPCGYRYKQVEE